MSPDLQQELRSLFVSVLVDAARDVLPMLAQASASTAGPATRLASEPENLLRPREAAKMMTVSERTLWKLVTSCEIPCVRIGRSVRYDPIAPRRWIDNSQSSPTPITNCPQGIRHVPTIAHRRIDVTAQHTRATRVHEPKTNHTKATIARKGRQRPSSINRFRERATRRSP
jgi:excisionase family DNA binding protein